MKIIVAIPCYNVERQIIRILKDFSQEQELLKQFEHVALIDNQSTDRTISAALEEIKNLKLQGRISVYRNEKNYGLGGTHKVAFQMALEQEATHLAILHGDHQATTRQLSELISESKQRNQGTILGSRFLPGSFLPGYSFLRIWGNRALNWLYSMLTGVHVHDLGVGINLFSLKDVHLPSVMKFDNSFTFNMDLLLHLINQKVALHFYPIDWKVADEKSNAKIFSVGWKTLKKVFAWKMKRPRIALSDEFYKTTEMKN